MIRYNGDYRFMLLDKDTSVNEKLSGLSSVLSADSFGSNGFYIEFSSGINFHSGIIVMSVGGTVLI